MSQEKAYDIGPKPQPLRKALHNKEFVLQGFKLELIHGVQQKILL